jgi:hypothetical protein
MINYIYGHVFKIEVGLFTLAHLSIDNPNKTWIIVLFISKVAATFSFCLFLVLRK